MGTDEEFTGLRRLLAESDYSPAGLRRRLGVEDLEKYPPQPAQELITRPLLDALDALMRLFYHSVYAHEADAARVLPPGALELLDSLGLLARDPDLPGMIYGASAILPASEILTVCDRGNHTPGGQQCELPPDIVYPAIFDTTRRFLGDLPDTPCDAMLDIGTGTGIAALLGARNARHAWASDITERSALFAEFNRRLHGVANMTVVVGDLFQPVERLTFDRIVIHPPYVPAKQSRLVFRDAGQDGEQILRRTVEELPRFLRPGGRFYSRQMATDREGESFEDRVRKWLGSSGAEFDIVTGVQSMQAPPEFIGNLIFAGRLELQNIEGLMETWKATKTVAMVYSALLIERHSEQHPPVTRRVQTGKGYTGRHLEEVLEWEQQCTRPETLERLLAGIPCLVPDCEVHVVSRMRPGGLCPEEFSFVARSPFRARAGCDASVAQVLMTCDGSRNCRDMWRDARGAGWIPEAVSETEFVRLLASFVAEGILLINGQKQYK